jgi:hypothetical protein
MPGLLTVSVQNQIAARLGYSGTVSKVAIEDLINAGAVPKDFKWTPTLCLFVDNKYIAVHLLETEAVPSYILTEASRLKDHGFQQVDVVVVATSVKSELSESNLVLSPARAAGNVAEVCRSHGIGLQFIQAGKVYRVFPPRYVVPVINDSSEETGHIPSWTYKKLEEIQSFSPYLSKVLNKFVKAYSKATKGLSINYNKEVELLRKLALDIGQGDSRLYIPIGQLDVLREWERAGANKKSRDHFFHTFNNLLLGYLILGSLKRPSDKNLGAVDENIRKEKGAQPQLASWEALWLITCLFHDPAYIAENFHSGTFRFSYGVVEDESGFGAEIQEAQKDKIVDLWKTEFLPVRELLRDLYNHSIRKWSSGGTRSPSKKDFDAAIGRAYFDGTQCSHSLISGIRLIQFCRADQAFDTKKREEPATTACVIAALGMMFHDQKCRDILRKAGVEPFAFSKLPYASILMFVDSLQDDRRDITKSRFPVNGVLQGLAIDPQNRTVKATVCLPRLDLKYWAGRISEYENVLSWVNHNPTTDVHFSIDYQTQAKLGVNEPSTK